MADRAVGVYLLPTLLLELQDVVGETVLPAVGLDKFIAEDAGLCLVLSPDLKLDGVLDFVEPLVYEVGRSQGADGPLMLALKFALLHHVEELRT